MAWQAKLSRLVGYRPVLAVEEHDTQCGVGGAGRVAAVHADRVDVSGAGLQFDGPPQFPRPFDRRDDLHDRRLSERLVEAGEHADA